MSIQNNDACLEHSDVEHFQNAVGVLKKDIEDRNRLIWLLVRQAGGCVLIPEEALQKFDVRRAMLQTMNTVASPPGVRLDAWEMP